MEATESNTQWDVGLTSSYAYVLYIGVKENVSKFLSNTFLLTRLVTMRSKRDYVEFVLL